MLIVSRRDTDNQLWLINVTHKVRANGRNNSQHCWPVARRLTGIKHCATTRKNENNMQQDVQTDATCNIQQCWEIVGQQCCVQLHRAMQVLSNVQVQH